MVMRASIQKRAIYYIVQHSLTIILLVQLSACLASLSQKRTDTIYVNGVIWTGVKEASDASVLAVEKGRIIYVGKELPTHIEANFSFDLDGKFVISGFIDNHVHFMEGGAELGSVDLRSANSPDEFVQRIADFGKELTIIGLYSCI